MKYLKAHFFLLLIAYFGNLKAQNYPDSICNEYYICDFKLNQSCMNYEAGDISFKTFYQDSIYATISYQPGQNGNYFISDTIRFPHNQVGKVVETKHKIYKPGFYILKICSKKHATLCATKFIVDYCSQVAFKKEVNIKDGNFKLVSHNQISDFHFSLFNNRGLEVFKTNDPDFSWNYQYFGKLIPSGEYYFSIEYNTVSIINSEYKSEAGILKINP